MGRAKINDLLSFFTLKYGPVESIEFQKARTNFIQSMAAYSLLCYIIQIKDRHNGNIMVDGRGCITHIGTFSFSSTPEGGKLTSLFVLDRFWFPFRYRSRCSSLLSLFLFVLFSFGRDRLAIPL